MYRGSADGFDGMQTTSASDAAVLCAITTYQVPGDYAAQHCSFLLRLLCLLFATLDTASCAGGEDPCHASDGLRNMAVLCWLLDYSRC